MRRRVHEAYHPDCVQTKVKHPTSVMVWGAISVKGTSELYVVQKTMEQHQYMSVLENILVPQLRHWYRRTTKYSFMQDGAPCHRSKLVKAYFLKSKITVLSWPGNSPDMNPIETIWNYMKLQLNKLNITNRGQLIDALQTIWKSETVRLKCQELIRNLNI